MEDAGIPMVMGLFRDRDTTSTFLVLLCFIIVAIIFDSSGLRVLRCIFTLLLKILTALVSVPLTREWFLMLWVLLSELKASVWLLLRDVSGSTLLPLPMFIGSLCFLRTNNVFCAFCGTFSTYSLSTGRPGFVGLAVGLGVPLLLIDSCDETLCLTVEISRVEGIVVVSVVNVLPVDVINVDLGGELAVTVVGLVVPTTCSRSPGIDLVKLTARGKSGEGLRREWFWI